MRAAERTPWADRRSSRHDEMCALVAAWPERLFPTYGGEVRARVEVPCGAGFCDVLVWQEAPPSEREAFIVEVKTRHEQTSAGDVLRQLRWYRQRLGGRFASVRLALVVENVSAVPSAMLDLLLHEGVDVLPVWYFEREAA